VAEDTTLRLDYTLYGLGIVLFVLAAISYIVLADPNTQIIVVVSAVIWGVIFIIIGFLMKPKTQVLTVSSHAEVVNSEVAPVTIHEEIPEEVKIFDAEPETAQTEPSSKPEISNQQIVEPINVVELTQIKGIGEKRAAQLKSNGVNNALDLAKCEVENLAEKLKVSPKIVEKWIKEAKEQTK
jgi:predicted flap endonuclease-1-like 5' DNA nuclease